jgi:predicted kinase
MRESTSSERPRIVLLIGLPGSGKSTYLEKLGVSSLSSDEMRRLLIDDATNQTIHGQVFASIRYLLRQRIRLERPVSYVDATNLTKKDRKPFLKMGKLYDCPIEALFFDVPLAVCKQRNRQRGRMVPEDVMDAMAARLAPPSVEEGFHKVTRIPALATDVEQTPKEFPG